MSVSTKITQIVTQVGGFESGTLALSRDQEEIQPQVGDTVNRHSIKTQINANSRFGF